MYVNGERISPKHSKKGVEQTQGLCQGNGEDTRKEGRPPPIYTPTIMIAPQLPTPEQNAPTPATAPTLSGIQLPTVAL